MKKTQKDVIELLDEKQAPHNGEAALKRGEFRVQFIRNTPNGCHVIEVEQVKGLFNLGWYAFDVTAHLPTPEQKTRVGSIHALHGHLEHVFDAYEKAVQAAEIV